MTIGTVFVPAFDEQGVRHTAPYARLFARAFTASLHLAHVRDPLPPAQLAEFYWDASVVEQFRENTARRAEAIRQEAASAIGADAFAWQLTDGLEEDLYGPQARLADLIIAPAPSQCSRQDAHRLVENLLVGCAKPVFMTPNPADEAIPQSYLVGWNGSVEAARALSVARPLLEAAKKVTIMSVGDISKSAPDATAAAEALTRSGIPAEGKTVKKHTSVTQTLVDEASTLGADALLLGGYSHSRLVERVLGGVTRKIISQPPMPVVLVH